MNLTIIPLALLFMKKLLAYSTLLLGILALTACEKDDICPEGTDTTPLIFMKFYRVEDQNQSNTTGTVYAKAIGFNDTIFRKGNELKLPLQINKEETTWVLTLNSVDEENQPIVRQDTLKFLYTPKTDYLNKACGYRTTFVLNEQTKMPILNDNKEGNWISIYELQTSFIENEQEEHLKIFY